MEWVEWFLAYRTENGCNGMEQERVGMNEMECERVKKSEME